MEKPTSNRHLQPTKTRFWWVGRAFLHNPKFTY